MKVPDLIPLKKEVLQLEEGHRKWNIGRCEAALIAFASSEAKLDPNEVEDD